jgi:beta-lactam-binding protein with PASTA domain
VPLLDGKYEILTERALDGGATRFEATSPGGETLRVIWYDVAPSDDGAFERYRRLLKGLVRDGSAAVVDVVSRPGARYVAWRIPLAELPRVADPTLQRAIEAAGFDPAVADVRRDGRTAVLFDLPFESRAGAAGTTPPSPASERAGTPRGSAPRQQLARLRRVRLSDDAMSWAVALGLLLLAVSAFAGGFAARANDRLVQVPDLLGASVHEAAPRLAGMGLRVDAAPVASDAAAGEVLAVDPPPGTALRPGRSVRLTYAVAPGRLAPVTVPAVVGARDADEAAARLEATGLRLGRIGRVHDQAPLEEVVAQSVPAGATLGQGQGVDILTSLGPRLETTFLPDLVGLRLEDARYLATVAGLTGDQVVVEEVATERGAPGRVLSQSLAPYARVPRSEATLRLLVASPPTAPESGAGLPSLAGLTLERARDLASGFDVRVETIEDRTLPDGVVMQSLPVGAEAGDGPLVLTVNVRPVPVPRPTPRVEVREATERELRFTWFIEPGIRTQQAQVRALTLRGDDVVVLEREVRGGETLSGTWTTMAPGPVRFTLTLNRQPYGEELLVP